MNQKSKVLLIILAFAVVLTASIFAVNFFTEKYPINLFERIKDDSGGSKKGNDNEIENENIDDEPSDENILYSAPDFEVTDLDGNTISLSSLFGKPIVLNFWASWCGPCASEMPVFQKVYDEMSEDVTFVMINLTSGRETRESAMKFIESNNYTFPIYFDLKNDASYEYAIRAIPTTYFIDKDGRLITGVQSVLDEENLRRGIEIIFETQKGNIK